MFSEHQPVRVGESLRQGDVLEKADLKDDKWSTLLLIITADCDLANRKHSGRITCIPILPAQQYILQFQIPKLAERIAAKQVKYLRDQLVQYEGPTLSDAGFEDMLNRNSNSEIISLLDTPDTRKTDMLSSLEALRLARNEWCDLTQAMADLKASLASGPQAKQPKSANKDVTDFVRAPFSNPPGDALFLSSVAPDLDGGYFAYLRDLEQLQESDIGTGALQRGRKYRRVARLEDRFTHALVQRFALVFMSIGLPDVYEETRDLHASLIGEVVQ